MFRIERVATTGLVALVLMPLLTELVSRENRVCYRHGAPNGAVRKPDSIDNSEELVFELCHFTLGILSCIIPTNPVLLAAQRSCRRQVQPASTACAPELGPEDGANQAVQPLGKDSLSALLSGYDVVWRNW